MSSVNTGVDQHAFGNLFVSPGIKCPQFSSQTGRENRQDDDNSSSKEIIDQQDIISALFSDNNEHLNQSSKRIAVPNQTLVVQNLAEEHKNTKNAHTRPLSNLDIHPFNPIDFGQISALKSTLPKLE